MGEYRPADARILGRERDGRYIDVSTFLQPSRPGALGIGLLVDDPQVRSRAVDEERAQIAITVASDLAKPLFAAARVLSGCNPR